MLLSLWPILMLCKSSEGLLASLIRSAQSLSSFTHALLVVHCVVCYEGILCCVYLWLETSVDKRFENSAQHSGFAGTIGRCNITGSLPSNYGAQTLLIRKGHPCATSLFRQSRSRNPCHQAKHESTPLQSKLRHPLSRKLNINYTSCLMRPVGVT